MAEVAYTSKGNIEKYLGVTIDGTLDAFITLLISFAEEYIIMTCSNEVGGRWFGTGDDEEEATRKYDGNGLMRLYLDDVREISEVTVDGIEFAADTGYIAYPLNAEADELPFEYIELVQPNSSAMLNTNSRMQAMVGSDQFRFTERQANVLVTGKFGYSPDVPPTIEMAALKLCAAVIKENIGDTDLKEITSETLGEYSATFAKVKDIGDKLGIPDMLEMFIRCKDFKSDGAMRLAE